MPFHSQDVRSASFMTRHRDVSTPTPQFMTTILDHVDQSMASGQPVYVHCCGGVGRTGTVVGCGGIMG